MLLVVERDPRFSAKLKRHLKANSLRLFFVETTQDAAFLLGNMAANAMVVDLNAVVRWDDVGVLSGYAAENQVPLLFIESSKTASLAARLRQKGDFQFISLPFRVGDLSKRIVDMLEKQDPLVQARLGPHGQEVRITKKLGSGSMGTVYEAYHESLERRVAVKFLAEHDVRVPESADRFLREARAMAQMRSPHVGQIFFTGTHQGRPYLVMEYIDGPDLGKYLRAKGVLGVIEAVRLIREILLGLDHAHRAGKIHRDIKPANIMLNADGHAVILDFGLVRELSVKGLTQAGTVLGTPRYISPEQVQGHGVDHRSDLYALGIIFFEMLIGRPPFVGQDLVSILMQQVKSPLPAPQDFGKAVDAEIWSIVERLTAKDPNQRFTSASQAIQAIDRWSQDVALSSGSSLHSYRNKVQPSGGLAVNEVGSLVHHFGDAAEEHASVLHILQSAFQQWQSATDSGPFERGLIDVGKNRMVLFTYFSGLAGLRTSVEDGMSLFQSVSLAELAALFETEVGT